MATVALALAAQGAGWSQVAVMVAATVGSYIDQTVVYPTLFPGDTVQPPRIGDVQLMQTQEGAGIPIVCGARAKVAGVLMWVGPLDDVSQSQSVGKNANVVNVLYYASVAVLICGNPISKVARVWFDAELQYDAERPDLSANSNQISVVPDLIFNNYAKIIAPISSGIDFSVWRTGPNADIVTTTFTNGANNGTFEVRSTYYDAIGARTWLYVKKASGGFVGEGPGGSSRHVNQEQPKWTPGTQKTGAPFFWRGQVTNDPSTHIEGYEGSGNVPAWRGWSWLEAQLLNITKTNVRIPSMEFLVERANGAELDDVVLDLFAELGFSFALCDVTGLSGIVGGYVVYTPCDLHQVLQPLMLAFDFVAQDRNGVIHFIFRDDAPIVVVDEIDLGAKDENGDPVARLKSSRPRPISLPCEVILEYVDSDDEYRKNTARKAIANNANGTVLKMSFDIIMTRDEADSLAKKMLWRSRGDIETVKLTLPPKYMRVLEGDELQLMIRGELRAVSVIKVSLGANYMVEIEGQVYETKGINY